MKSFSQIDHELERIRQAQDCIDGADAVEELERARLYGAMQALEWAYGLDAMAPADAFGDTAKGKCCE